MNTEAEAIGPDMSRSQSRGRATAVWIVLVLAGLLLLLSSFAVWIDRVALSDACGQADDSVAAQSHDWWNAHGARHRDGDRERP